MSILFNFLYQNPLKLAFSGYFSTKSITSNKWPTPLKNVHAFIRGYIVHGIDYKVHRQLKRVVELNNVYD